MFNFFSEVKKGVKNFDLTGKYNIVNISGEILYVEGHKGVALLSKTQISFKVKNGRLLIEGDNLVLVELTEDTLKISGKISKIEAL